MKKIILIALLFSATLSSMPTAKADTTRFVGFAIGDRADTVMRICVEKLKYAIYTNKIDEDISTMTCEPSQMFADKEYSKAIIGKPTEVYFMLHKNKVTGIHMMFTSRVNYKNSVADFVASGIMEDGREEVNSLLPPQKIYRNFKENWVGWYYEFETIPTQTLYTIHVEFSVSPTYIDNTK